MQAGASSIYTSMLGMANILTVTDFLGNNVGLAATIQPQLMLAGASGVYGSWSNFSQGQVSAQYLQVRLSCATTRPAGDDAADRASRSRSMCSRWRRAGVAVAVPGAGAHGFFPFRLCEYAFAARHHHRRRAQRCADDFQPDRHGVYRAGGEWQRQRGGEIHRLVFLRFLIPDP